MTVTNMSAFLCGRYFYALYENNMNGMGGFRVINIINMMLCIVTYKLSFRKIRRRGKNEKFWRKKRVQMIKFG